MIEKTEELCFFYVQSGANFGRPHFQNSFFANLGDAFSLTVRTQNVPETFCP